MLDKHALANAKLVSVTVKNNIFLSAFRFFQMWAGSAFVLSTDIYTPHSYEFTAHKIENNHTVNKSKNKAWFEEDILTGKIQVRIELGHIP